MPTYTTDQLKEYTQQPIVHVWAPAKILIYQTMAEAVLTGLDLDSSVVGYTDAYNSAVILLFDWLVQNPTGVKSMTKGRVKFEFNDLPATVRLVLQRAIEGSDGTLQSTDLERMDIGRR